MQSANTRFVLVAAAWIVIGTEACGLAIGGSELPQVQCEQEGQLGHPACATGQYCRQGMCTPCALQETCDNGLDDDCNLMVDDGCGGVGGRDGGQPDVSSDVSSPNGGAGGGGGDPTGGSGGAAGGTSSGGSNTGGQPTGGSGGLAGSGGASTGGAAGQPTGGAAGQPTGGAAGQSTGGAAGGAGAGTCDIEVVNNPTCDACLNASCHSECAACSANSACLDMIDCVWDCGGDDTCVGPCNNQHPTGAVDYAGLRACLNTDCTAQCPTGAAGSGGGSGSGGTGGSSCGAIGASCTTAGQCCNQYCCQNYSKNTCRKPNYTSCGSDNECCTGNCWAGYCTY